MPWPSVAKAASIKPNCRTLRKMTISNDQSSSLSPRGAWLFALTFWTAGLAIIGVALGWIPIAAQDIHAPRWVGGAAGVTFIAAGFAPLVGRWGPASIMSQIVSAGVVLPLTLVANWVAFGPGVRQFSGGLSFGFFALSQRTSELSGRIAFGIGAILLDILIVMFVVRRLQGKNRTSK
jgi:hypothetical protein